MFSEVRLSNHIVEQLLRVEQQLGISVGEGFVVVPDCCKEFRFVFGNLHNNCFLFHILVVYLRHCKDTTNFRINQTFYYKIL